MMDAAMIDAAMMDALGGGPMPAHALLAADRPASAAAARRRPADHLGSCPSPELLLSLQRTAGNAAVRSRFGHEPEVAVRPVTQPAVQRCGPVPCDCSAVQRAEYESEHDPSEPDRVDGASEETTGVQRVAEGPQSGGTTWSSEVPVGPSARNQSTVQRYEVQDCGGTAQARHPAAEVHAAHGRARTMLSIAEMESATSTDPTVQTLARKYFKITVPPVRAADKKLWFGRVRRVLSAMNSENSKTTYECEPSQSWRNGLCSTGTFAVTILNIHLCPNWWTLNAVDDRAFVLLHEWAHRYGPSVNQILETYCDAKEFSGLSADDLVAEPDAYASYIFELVTGKAPGAAVC